MKFADVLSGSAGLAGVQWAVNGRTARQLLHAELQRLLAPGYHAGSLRLTRVKYKPNDKINAYYTFTVSNGLSGAEKTLPMAVHWRAKPDTTDPADTFGPMQAEAQAHGLLDPFVQLWSDLPETGMRLQVWPMDPEFPQLVRLGDPQDVSGLLEGLGLSASGGGGQPVSVDPIRYRPRERHVLRYKLPEGQGRYYAKLYQDPEDAERAFRIANRVVDCLESSLQDFCGVRPSGMSAADGVILYPHVEGTPLSRRLDHSPRVLARCLRATGAALYLLHQGPAGLLEDLKENNFEKEARVIRRASEHIRVLLPETGEKINLLLDRALQLHEGLPHEPPTFTHSDFKADHLLINAQRQVTLIDFDTCALADPALDLGKFLADLRWWYSQQNRSGVEQAQAEFLAGYQQGDVADRLARARLYEVLILIKITARRVRLAAPNWAETTVRLINQAEQLLELEKSTVMR